MNLFLTQAETVGVALRKLARDGVLAEIPDASRVLVEAPRDVSHGDFSSNIALVCGKGGEGGPPALAARLAEALSEQPQILEASAAGPGFVNWRLTPEAWQAALAEVLTTGDAWPFRDLGGGEGVNVEFVSANPTGPLTVAHARGAVLGDVISTLLERFGYKVEREYYINDAGSQMETLAKTVLLRCREARGEDVGEIPEGMYPGEYLKEVAQALLERQPELLDESQGEVAQVQAVARFAADEIMRWTKKDLADLGVVHTVFSSERALVAAKAVEKVVEVLTPRGLVYTGQLEAPKGELPDDWEPRDQLLFRASEFGDTTDRPLQRSNGAWTYLAGDMAYHWDKHLRGATRLIDVLGADHAGYVKRISAATTALSEGRARVEVLTCQLVRLLRGGREVRMSKRSGSFVSLREVLDEVGAAPLRFLLLARKPNAPVDFDLEVVREQTLDNPLFYVQYAHARACSVMRLAEETFPELDQARESLACAELTRLSETAELFAIAELHRAPKVLESAVVALEPHRLTAWLRALAAAFHALWQQGRGAEQLRFVVPGDAEATRARLALVAAIRDGLALGMGLIGVQPLERL